MNEILLPAQIAGKQKWDFNNRGPFSTDYIGKSWDYPNASYKRRAAMWQDHKVYTEELFYFLVTDPSVPKETQAEIAQFGLAKDEFTDNNHWPYQLYVREARRLVGDYVVTQKDIQTELTKSDVIAMGSYNSDSHNVQRYVTPEGHAQNEGNMEVAVTPYQIPYRILLPKKNASDQSVRAGLFFRQPRHLFDAANGASIYDDRPGCRPRREDGASKRKSQSRRLTLPP